VCFTGCDVTSGNFSAARVVNCEFHDCNLQDLRGIEGLRGAAIEWSELVGLTGVMANALGIRTLQPHER
jgi:hypothetical protein